MLVLLHLIFLQNAHFLIGIFHSDPQESSASCTVISIRPVSGSAMDMFVVGQAVVDVLHIPLGLADEMRLPRHKAGLRRDQTLQGRCLLAHVPQRLFHHVVGHIGACGVN